MEPITGTVGNSWGCTNHTRSSQHSGIPLDALFCLCLRWNLCVGFCSLIWSRFLQGPSRWGGRRRYSGVIPGNKLLQWCLCIPTFYSFFVICWWIRLLLWASFYSHCRFLVMGCQLQILSLSQGAQVLRLVRQVLQLFLLVLCSMVLSRWRCRFRQWIKLYCLIAFFPVRILKDVEFALLEVIDRMLKFGNRRCFNWESAKIMFLVLEVVKIWNRIQSSFIHPSTLGTDGAWRKDRYKPLEPITGTGGLIDIVLSFKWSEITQFVSLFGVYLISLCNNLFRKPWIRFRRPSSSLENRKMHEN